MKAGIRKFFIFLLVVMVLFFVTMMSVLVLVPLIEESGISLLVAGLICGGIVTVLNFPIFIWFTFSRYATPKKYQAFILQEINLSEAEINQAIDSWAYAKHRVRMEDKATFLEDENGTVSCQITVRKD